MRQLTERVSSSEADALPPQKYHHFVGYKSPLAPFLGMPCEEPS